MRFFHLIPTTRKIENFSACVKMKKGVTGDAANIWMNVMEICVNHIVHTAVLVSQPIMSDAFCIRNQLLCSRDHLQR